MTIQLNNASTNNSTVNNTNSSNTAATNTQQVGNDSNKTTTAQTDDIQLSTRAQKIQKLNQEFFPNGPGSLRITQDFIQRLQEYGFLNESEAEKLGAPFKDSTKLPDTLETMSNNISILINRVKTEDSEDPLIPILERSDAILNNLDGSNPSELAKDISSVNAELTNYLNSSSADKLTDEEKTALDELSTALKVADRLNPTNLSAEKLNQYLSFL